MDGRNDVRYWNFLRGGIMYLWDISYLLSAKFDYWWLGDNWYMFVVR